MKNRWVLFPAGAIAVGAALAAALVLGIGMDQSILGEEPILFQSAESSAPAFGPILNRVQWVSEPDCDLWIMQQNQARRSHPFLNWDRLAILIDKTKTPKEARFFQLAPGPVAPSLASLHQEREYRVTCGACHVNGPRALRPVFSFFGTPAGETPAVTIGLREFARLQLWNLRIKTYGRIVTPPPTEMVAGHRRRVPFLFPGEHARLTVKTCAYCHNDSWWGRGTLTRAQVPSIRFLVEGGHMPPPGLSLSAEERAELDAFVAGH